MTPNANTAPPENQLWVELSQSSNNDVDVRAILSDGAAYIDKKLAEMNL